MSHPRPDIRIAMIVARARNGVIGRDGDLPWRLPTDLKHFKATTLGKPIIMGRKTWDSFPKRPLPKRPNIVVSRQSDTLAEGARTYPDLNLALAAGTAIAAKAGQDEIYIVGGAQVYADALPVVDRIYLTEVDANPEGDTFLPLLAAGDWKEIASVAHPASGTDDHAFTIRTLERVWSHE